MLGAWLAREPGEPLETRLRILLVRLGIRFRAQHWVRTRDGRRYARVDFYLPQLGVVVEFDAQGLADAVGLVGQQR